MQVELFNRLERVPSLLPIHFKNPNLAPGRINLVESDPSHFPFEAQNAQYIHGEKSLNETLLSGDSPRRKRGHETE